MTSVTRMDTRAAARDLEFVAYTTADLPASLPRRPGEVQYLEGEPVLLYVAPGRWFAPAAAEAVRTRLAGLGESGTTVDLEGYWARIDVTGPRATAVLSATIDVLAVLDGRDCAAVTLFDCPARVVRLGNGYAVWTRASHGAHLGAELARVGADGR